MSIQNIQEVKKLFDFVELRFAIVLGMILQIPLMLWPNLRKLCVSHPYIRIIGLVCYLAIDFCSTLTLGMLFRVNMDTKANDDQNPRNKYLLAFWATLVLRHLSAHSTITAFSLADNEFWFRHIIRFVYHELMAFFICVLSFTETRLRFPSCVLFIVSTFKFGEGVWALKRGGLDELKRSTIKKSDAGQRIILIFDMAEIILAEHRAGNLGFKGDHHLNMPEDQANRDLDIHSTRTNVQDLCVAYQTFKKHKHLYIGNFFYRQGEGELGQHFGSMDSVNSCRWVETQLNFAYDTFYTKKVFLHSLWGWIFRIILLLLICLALGGFAVIDKSGFLKSDVILTYIFLSITLFLDMVSFLESVTSNQTLVQVGFQAGKKWRFVEKIILSLLSIERSIERRTIRRIFPRQSISMGQFSLLSFCYNDYRSWKWTKELLNFFDLKAYWDNYWYTLCISLDDHSELKYIIFSQVRSRIEEERSSRERENWFSDIVSRRVSTELSQNTILEASIGSDFERCVIIWHLAIDICYRALEQPPVNLQNAKYISENMMYLLKVHPSMLSSLTTYELKSYNSAFSATTQMFPYFGITNDGVEVYEAWENMSSTIDTLPEENRVGINFDAFKLAYELRRLMSGNQNVCELMLKVWIDILSYAAFHSQGKDHAERLGSGGEFLTHVWLFMHHLIIGSRNQIEIQNAGGQE